MFKPVDPKVSFPELEEKTISYWKENNIFEKSVESRPKDRVWTFLDGPPFITGMPHYGSLLSSIPKDVFPRYWTMKGYSVRRVWGWDCHGLPAENKVETKLGLTRKKDIEEKIGVKKFIDECKLYVSEVSSEWEWYVDHIGRWVDFKNAYRTMDRDYMESVMWVFKQMYEKGFIYKGLRVSLFCPHCSTPISNFEVAMDVDNYKEVPDAATTYKYELEEERGTYILAWSTTPWNKIVTPALAVNPELVYVKVEQGSEKYILAKTTIKTLGDEGSYTILDEFKGRALVGKKYIPHYDYYKDKIQEGKSAFVIIPGDFVTADEGTGVVTIAVYGEEDLKAMQEHNIHMQMHVDDEGTILPEVPKFGGMYYLKANKEVNLDLAERGLIYKDEELPHKVPLCWRCHTRLYYNPQNAWYVNIQILKEKLKKTNEGVNWFPSHFKGGRFLKSLENAPDWNISRSRYWGSPVPVWECECGERFVAGSIAELEEASGVKIEDLHKPEIDDVEVNCKKCGKKAKRVPEVLDSWIEAGSASFAERHYPFQDADLNSFFPPDFIAEYTGQIRAWFYVLHVIGGALFDSPAFKNVVVEGVILGTDGRKMSKNYGNYPDPKELIGKYGGDALRLYLMGSPVMHGEDILISEEQYRNQVRGLLLVFWNVYNFFINNANADGWEKEKYAESSNILDQWILSRLNGNIKNTTKAYEEYDLPEVVGQANIFIQDLSVWYLRRSRERMGPNAEAGESEKNDAYSTLWFVLKEYAKTLAPIIPFITEEIYRNLTGEESVHLSDWSQVDEGKINQNLEVEMDVAREIVEEAHAIRKKEMIKVRQPLSAINIVSPIIFSDAVRSVIADEVNVKNVNVTKGEKVTVELDLNLTQELKDEGVARDLVRTIQAERKKIGTKLNDWVDVKLENWPASFEEEIKKKALIRNLTKGEVMSVEVVNE
ncbi:MAG: isoleucine--tRNA ligase [Candidatus Levybacteria bacterium]|nr:isoleucine--tRNA ligase [Candidatus Levybacteria bacterium]